MPDVTEVGNYAFASNARLASVTLGALTEIGSYAYYETGITELPPITKDTDIGIYAFAYSHLKSVTVPDGMVVAEGVFCECSELSSVTVGNDVVLGLYAFGMNKDDWFSIENYDEDGEKYFYYKFSGPLKELVIGENVTIGERAFVCAADLESVSLGSGAKIDRMAFFNCASLKDIDLSGALEIGEYAFSGDVYHVCSDENMSSAAVSKTGYYIYTYFSPAIEKLDLSSAESVAGYAFSYCRSLEEIILGEQITEIAEYTFAGCTSLVSANLGNLVSIGGYAFMEADLATADLSSAELVGEYAFVDNASLQTVTLNPNGAQLDEGAFAEDNYLAIVENLDKAQRIGDGAFAYTALTRIDLSSAEYIGKQAFIKEKLTSINVTLGDKLTALGDNPFAMCVIEPFTALGTTEINGHEVEAVLTSFAISDSVKVEDGSLYVAVPNGWVLVTYTGNNAENVCVPEGTVRIASMAFAGSKVQTVTLPYTVAAIGHKAFYDCNSLKTVVFESYEAPILEEEFDSTYFESLEHIPGSGDYGEYIDYNRETVQIFGMGMLPYYMWNVTDSMYFCVYYGANFVDYVGYVDESILMVRPENGVGYDSFIMDRYFDLSVEGKTAPEDATVAAIRAIDAIPDKVTYEDKALVEAAREAYGKIATLAQQALVTNYSKLISAEQRVSALAPTADVDSTDDTAEESSENTWVLPTVIAVCVLALLAAVVVFKKRAAQKAENNIDGGNVDEKEA